MKFPASQICLSAPTLLWELQISCFAKREAGRYALFGLRFSWDEHLACVLFWFSWDFFRHFLGMNVLGDEFSLGFLGFLGCFGLKSVDLQKLQYRPGRKTLCKGKGVTEKTSAPCLWSQPLTRPILDQVVKKTYSQTGRFCNVVNKVKHTDLYLNSEASKHI